MKKTRIYTIKQLNDTLVQQDIQTTFQQGGNVVFPTETVYGIGASALSKQGIEGIYDVKGRPNDNPLIMHLADMKDLERYVMIKHKYIKQLMDTFWPGPLTLVFDKTNHVPDYFTGGLKTVGVRIPGSHIARQIIEIANVPICAPSANISGRPSSTLFKHVLEDFNHKVDILIDGGKSQVGLESTVLDVTEEIPVILRPGMITPEMIKQVTGEVKMKSELVEGEIPKSPGMKYKHYAPKGLMEIVEGNIEKVIAYINKKTKEHQVNLQKVGVIVTTDLKDRFIANYLFDLGSFEDKAKIASNLYEALREMDALNVDYIYSLSFHKGTYSEAIMNRLRKAANHHIKRL